MKNFFFIIPTINMQDQTQNSSTQYDRIKNLGVILHHFIGLELAVECKNGQMFQGVLLEADDCMNVVLQKNNTKQNISNLTFQTQQQHQQPHDDNDEYFNSPSPSSSSFSQIDDFQAVHIRGSNIRYIHFPDTADLPKLVRLGLDRIKSATDKYARGIRKRRKVD
mmetsp:Transcript_10315/g.19290  ORF Transcript_10315/g.19290 Transcript_10315/m.19290 type:complete len:165 (-) Transcript_10315:555-1049(-)